MEEVSQEKERCRSVMGLLESTPWLSSAVGDLLASDNSSQLLRGAAATESPVQTAESPRQPLDPQAQSGDGSGSQPSTRMPPQTWEPPHTYHLPSPPTSIFMPTSTPASPLARRASKEERANMDSPQSPPDDEDKAFFKSMEASLKQLKPRKRAEVKLLIHRLIHEAEMEAMEGQSEQ